MKPKVLTDRLVGFSAMLISLMTLVIFLYQTNLQKNQSRLSVRPRLTFSKHIDQTVSVTDSSNTIKVKMRLTVRNNGLGPAIIERGVINDRDREYDMASFFDQAYPKMREFGFFSQMTDLTIGEAIPASESVDLFTYEYDESVEKGLLSYLGVDAPYELPFSVKLEYSSMYEERWRVESNREGHPERLD